MATEAPLLRPLSVAEVLDTTFTIYRRNFKELVGISAAVQVPLGLLQAAVVAYFLRGASSDPIASLGAIGPSLLTWPVAVVGSTIVYAALTVAVSRHYLREPTTLTGAFTYVLPRFWALLGALIVVGLVSLVGYCFCILPGVYLWILFSFAFPVVLLERAGVGEAMSRSVYLISGSWWRVAGTLVAVGIIVGIPQAALLYPLMGLRMSGVIPQSLYYPLATLAQTLVMVFALPISKGVLVVLYYDLRVRREGFDLQLLFSEIAPKVGMAGATLPPMPGKPEPPPTVAQPAPAVFSSDLPPAPGPAAAPMPASPAQETSVPTSEQALFPERPDLPPPPAEPTPPPMPEAPPPPPPADDSSGLPPPPTQ